MHFRLNRSFVHEQFILNSYSVHASSVYVWHQRRGARRKPLTAHSISPLSRAAEERNRKNMKIGFWELVVIVVTNHGQLSHATDSGNQLLCRQPLFIPKKESDKYHQRQANPGSWMNRSTAWIWKVPISSPSSCNNSGKGAKQCWSPHMFSKH